MTHTAEPMTLAKISDAIGEKLREAGSYAKWTNLHHAIVEWREAIDAELAKQRETVPVAWRITTEVIDEGMRPAGTKTFVTDDEKQAYLHATNNASVAPLYIHPQQRNAVDGNKPEKRWPFVESPGDFTERLAIAMQNFPLLGAVRHVLIEDPPNLSAVASRDREDAWIEGWKQGFVSTLPPLSAIKTETLHAMAVKAYAARLENKP
jgi:hypothetical protein